MRSGTRLMIVAAIYVIALIGLPFGHHDLVCHVTSSTHCANCHFSSAADNSGTQAGAAPIVLADAGRVEAPAVLRLVSASPALSPGRSPPPAPASISL
ncbi:MAG TPA: hypothetical protein VF159_02455 [Gemmatimonadaceae bacterium]|nr:hypothetical protein [Vicinamibacterales bacterium]